ncbi:MAG TPA: magnesium-translocating P-type ATPase [Candidatus Acidoferrales bacterium]|nr:magnesium-translocating P-type ATPase [Candidatus Acidoferrales bacterium]
MSGLWISRPDRGQVVLVPPMTAIADSSIPPTEPTIAADGLTSEEAARLISRYGPNDPAPVKRGTAVLELLVLFLNPLVIILMVASVVSFLLGDAVDAGIILLMVLLGVAINFVQTYRSQRAIEQLREKVTPTATVLRDGAWKEIKRHEVVPGDVVRVSAGDLIPADGKLVASRDLYVQQAALTGESLPSEKDARAAVSEGAGTPESPNLVFLGTSVVSGTGTAVIFATGPRTAFGEVAERLVGRPEETEFERSMRRFGWLIMRAVFFLVLFIVIVRVALHKDAFESFVFAVALAVGLTPEFLPMITSVTFARGAVRMAKDQVVVKHLPAIQNFGTIDVFCSDKTGTLTTGEMILSSSLDAFGERSDRPLHLAYLNSSFETGIRSPLDVAILSQRPSDAGAYLKCDEIPFDFERRRLSIVVEERDAGAGSRQLISKGAPEGILELCESYESGGRALALDSAARQRCRDTFERLSGQGFRVLAVAWRDAGAQSAFAPADERSLVLAGYLAFADPPSPDAGASVAAMKRDGVEVKILTGDNELVARHVCEQVGLPNPAILLGEELERTTDTALQHLAEQTTVFARVSPMQKHRIIHALKTRGHVVGYMGDGINDAPSLHAADVGISVATAVDVAREAADIILLKPGLQILHKGIIEGRRASANVLKYLLMGTSSNFGNMFSMAGASVFLPFLPMLPTQILLNNFLYDTAQITIPSDNVDPQYIGAPRRWNMTLIRNFMIFIGPISSIYDFLTFYVLLHFFHAAPPEFHAGWFVESLATQTLVLFVIRTMGNPFKSRPSLPLAATTILIVALGAWIPYSPVARVLGFTALPGPFFTFLAVSTLTYLALVELAKRLLFARTAI